MGKEGQGVDGTALRPGVNRKGEDVNDTSLQPGVRGEGRRQQYITAPGRAWEGGTSSALQANRAGGLQRSDWGAPAPCSKWELEVEASRAHPCSLQLAGALRGAHYSWQARPGKLRSTQECACHSHSEVRTMRIATSTALRRRR